MKFPARAINVSAQTRRLDIDNRISLRYYYRIADSLLRQADIYREEKNIIDLYVILLRYSSLVSETIPCHRDYKVLLSIEKNTFKKKLVDAIRELETLKPHVQREIDELNRQHLAELDVQDKMACTSFDSSYEWPPTRNQASNSWPGKRQMVVTISETGAPQASRKYSNGLVQEDLNRALHRQNYKLFPRPKEETLSRHSILGPNGLRGQWQPPVTGTRVQYPDNMDLAPVEIPSINHVGQEGAVTEKCGDSEVGMSAMDSVLSLDDGRWSLPEEKLLQTVPSDTGISSTEPIVIRQPTPPPVLAQVEVFNPIPPSEVADPTPGPALSSCDGPDRSKTLLRLHLPVKIMEDFMRLAQKNTKRNLETCGILAGSLKNRKFSITTLIIPKQESTSDTCQTTNEEEIFDVQDQRSLFPLGWIHTHPTQSCFMSSVDVHTHYSYQIMLPEAIAIVMAPTDVSRKHGIFHLSDPGGITVIRQCRERGFHSHVAPSDGSSIYEHCSHVYMDPKLDFDVVDLR
ncbi:AMSH-like ubiquitin thioesterase 3 [Nymphaea colorata]|nr:AMSH-like ubiquitin thioesterase 3 [Nymphaea colorata]